MIPFLMARHHGQSPGSTQYGNDAACFIAGDIIASIVGPGQKIDTGMGEIMPISDQNPSKQMGGGF